MAHLHPVYDADPHFVVDKDTRIISYPAGTKLVLIQMDHNSQRYTFEMPRYIDGHDMTLCDLVQMHYININADNARIRGTGIYLVTDLQISPDDENTVVWSWLVSQNATRYVGSLNFVARFVCTSGSKIDYEWNTRVYSEIAISTSINNNDLIIEQYDDTLQAWYMELLSAGTTGVDIVTEAKDNALAAIREAADSAATEAANSAIDKIVNTSTESITETVRENVLVTAREEIIQEVLNRIPIYNGEVVE